MSYPDFGCYAQCLVCELCETGLDLPDPPPDLDLPADWPGAEEDPFGLDDWAPEDPDTPSFDFDLPGWGDLDILPMNPSKGYGVTVGGKF